MNFAIRSRGFCVALILALPVTALGDAIPASLRACAGLTDDNFRLACYDRELAAVQAAAAVVTPAVPATPAAPAASVAAVTKSPDDEDEFGMTGDMRREAQSRGEEEEQLSEITAKVTKVVKGGSGTLTITLDNGQVWRQKYPSTSFRLREGDETRVKRGRLGGYTIIGRGRRGAQVTRIQ